MMRLKINMKYVNVLEEIKAQRDGEGDDPDRVEIDIDYELESVKTEEINYEYVLMLIQSFVPSGQGQHELKGDNMPI